MIRLGEAVQSIALVTLVESELEGTEISAIQAMYAITAHVIKHVGRLCRPLSFHL